MDHKEPKDLSAEDHSQSLREKIEFILKKLIDNVLHGHDVNESRSNVMSHTSGLCTCDPLLTKNDILDKLMDLTCKLCGFTDSEFYKTKRPCKICESQSKLHTPSTKGKETSKENEKGVQFNSSTFLHGEPMLENPQVLKENTTKSDPRPIQDSESMNKEQLQKVTLLQTEPSSSNAKFESSHLLDDNKNEPKLEDPKMHEKKTNTLEPRTMNDTAATDKEQPQKATLLQSEPSQNSQVTKKYEKPGSSAEISYPSSPKCKQNRDKHVHDSYIKKCCEAVKLLWLQHPTVVQITNEIKPEILDLITTTSDRLRNIAILQEGHILSEKPIDPKLQDGSLLIDEHLLKQKTLDLLVSVVCELREELANESDRTTGSKRSDSATTKNYISRTDSATIKNYISETDSSYNELKSKISNLVIKTAKKLNLQKKELNTSSDNNVHQVKQDTDVTKANHFSPTISPSGHESTTEQENLNFTFQGFNKLNDHDEARHTSILILNDVIDQAVLADSSIQRRPTEENIKENVWDIVKNALIQLIRVGEYKESISIGSPFPLPNIFTVQDKVHYVLERIILTTNKMMKEGVIPHSPFATHSSDETDSQSDPRLRKLYEEIRQDIILLVMTITHNIMQEVPIEETEVNGVTVPPLSPLVRHSVQTELQKQILKSIIIAAEKLKTEQAFYSDDPPIINPDNESLKMLDSTEKDEVECKQTTIPILPGISEPKQYILTIINEILDDTIKQVEHSDQKSEIESPMDIECHTDCPTNTLKHEIPSTAEVCCIYDEELSKLNICDSEEMVTNISNYAMDNSQLSDTKKTSDHLCKNSKPCVSYRIAKVLASNQEHIEALNKKKDNTDNLERNKETNNSNTSQVHREKMYKDKLKQYIHDLVKLSMQELSQQKGRQTNNKSTDDKTCIKPCPGEHSDTDIQALIIIIEAFLDKFITISCECEFPLEELYNLLCTITKAVENTSNEEFQKYVFGITQEDSSRKEVNDAAPKSWILGQTFDIEPKETKPTDDTPEICDNIYEQKTDGSQEENRDLNVVDVIPVRRTQDCIIQTESNHDFDDRRKALPCSPLMRKTTQLQFKHQVDLWFKEFKDFYQLFTRQSNFVVKNDFVLATSREKLESLNNIITKCTTNLEYIEKSLRETDELQCECLTIHSMYLNADIKGKGERERMYTNLLHVKQNLDETSKLKDVINEHIKGKIDGSLITKVTRILNCFANTLQGVEYKIQVLERELQAVKNLSAAVISKKLWS